MENNPILQVIHSENQYGLVVEILPFMTISINDENENERLKEIRNEFHKTINEKPQDVLVNGIIDTNKMSLKFSKMVIPFLKENVSGFDEMEISDTIISYLVEDKENGYTFIILFESPKEHYIINDIHNIKLVDNQISFKAIATCLESMEDNADNNALLSKGNSIASLEKLKKEIGGN